MERPMSALESLSESAWLNALRVLGSEIMVLNSAMLHLERELALMKGRI
jgi:hypothetical protein